MLRSDCSRRPVLVQALAAVVAAFAAAGLAAAEVIRVPQDYPTIQAGIRAAVDGDEVVVDDGVWTGPENKNLSMHGKAITVHSANGPTNCILDAEGQGRGFDLRHRPHRDTVIEGFTFTGSTQEGGGIYLEDASPTIRGCAFRGLENGAMLIEGGAPEIVDCQFEANDRERYAWGGSIDAVGASPTIRGCVFKEEDKGDIVIEGGTPYIVDCRFEGNGKWNYKYGGVGVGISAVDAEVLLESCTFVDNRASSGGAIYCRGGRSTIRQCTFVNNWARYGGGILISGSHNLSIEQSRFEENLAVAGGGAINVRGEAGGVIATDCEFTRNHDGPPDRANDILASAIAMWGGRGRFINCRFTGNDAFRDYDRSVIATYRAEIVMDSCHVSKNSGGITFNDTRGVIRNCVIEDNSGRYGAALTVSSEAMIIEGCILRGNSGPGLVFSHSVLDDDIVVRDCEIIENTGLYAKGVSVRSDSGRIRMERCLIAGNGQANGSGGGVDVSGEKVNFTLDACLITGNQASHGAGLRLSYGACTVVNSLIAGNAATGDGGGVYVTNRASGNLICSAVVDNSAEKSGGGAYVTDGVRLDLASSILWGNKAPQGPQIALSSGDQTPRVVISYCDLEGGKNGIM